MYHGWVLTSIRERSIGITRNLSFGKLQQVTIDLLSLTRQPECLMEISECVDEWLIPVIEHINECMHRGEVDFVPV